MTLFNKLVRDKIPEIIKQSGENPNYEILSNDGLLFELDKKLDEEIHEYQESKEIEELADVLEVIYAICKARGHSIDDLHRLCDEKRSARGGFDKKYFLISKE